MLGALVLLAPARASAQTDAGIFAAVLSGVHEGEDVQTFSGIGAGGLLEVTQRFGGARLHLEGVPRVTLTANGGPFGRSSVALSLLNATFSQDLDPRGRFRAGVGYQLVNLSNFNGTSGDRNYSRVTSPRFELGSTLPAGRNAFVEVNVAVLPNVNGILHVVDINNNPARDRPERGAEVDYGAAYGWNANRTTYLVGVRALSYHTRNTSTGALVDRNVGGGLTLEARLHL